MRYRVPKPWEKDTSPKQKTARKRLWLLILNFILIFGLYQVGIRLEWAWLVILYMVTLPVLFLVFVVLNHGTSTKMPTADMLPDTMTDEEKSAFLQRLAADKEKAKTVMLFVLPLLLTIGIDFIYLRFFPA